MLEEPDFVTWLGSQGNRCDPVLNALARLFVDPGQQRWSEKAWLRLLDNPNLMLVAAEQPGRRLKKLRHRLAPLLSLCPADEEAVRVQILLAACLGVRGPLNHAAQRLPASVPDQTFATAVVGSIRWFTKTCAHIVEQRRGIELLDPELFNERRAARFKPETWKAVFSNHDNVPENWLRAHRGRWDID